MLCTIGDLIEDVVVWLSAEPNLGTDTDSIIQRTRGGSAANVAMFAALTGTEARFIGQVGNDVLGQQLCLALQQAGVDVRVVSEGRTGSIGAGRIGELFDTVIGNIIGRTDTVG